MYYSTMYTSPLGGVKLVCNEENLAGLWFTGQKYFGASVTGEVKEDGGQPVLKAAKTWLDRYFAGEKPKISELPLAPNGSEFRREVWKILCEIPYGEVMTYGEIARKIAAETNSKMSARAVGGAVGHNPISVIIPCHRVVGADGSLTGYAGGVDKKIKLLELEGVASEMFFISGRGTAI